MANEPVVTIVGNVVADPEGRISQAGKPWVTFRIANTPRVKDRQTGEWGDGEALWVGCRAFGDMADNITQTLKKGMRVIVTGSLSQRSYKDSQGQERTSLDLEVEEVGPSLRFATASIARGGQGGPAGGGYEKPGYGSAPSYGQTDGGGYGQTQGQTAWAESPTPESLTDFGSGFDDEPEF